LRPRLDWRTQHLRLAANTRSGRHRRLRAVGEPRPPRGNGPDRTRSGPLLSFGCWRLTRRVCRTPRRGTTRS
jgi:hypothetical protein